MAQVMNAVIKERTYIIISVGFLTELALYVNIKRKAPEKIRGLKFSFIVAAFRRSWHAVKHAATCCRPVPYDAALAVSTSLVKLAGSEIARSARIFRSIATPFFVRPAMNLL